MYVNMSKDQPPVPATEKINLKQTNKQQDEKTTSTPAKQNTPAAEDNEDDPLLKEGYLPEIYFTLKSDNPADW